MILLTSKSFLWTSPWPCKLYFWWSFKIRKRVEKFANISEFVNSRMAAMRKRNTKLVTWCWQPWRFYKLSFVIRKTVGSRRAFFVLWFCLCSSMYSLLDVTDPTVRVSNLVVELVISLGSIRQWFDTVRDLGSTTTAFAAATSRK